VQWVYGTDCLHCLAWSARPTSSSCLYRCRSKWYLVSAPPKVESVTWKRPLTDLTVAAYEALASSCHSNLRTSSCAFTRRIQKSEVSLFSRCPNCVNADVAVTSRYLVREPLSRSVYILSLAPRVRPKLTFLFRRRLRYSCAPLLLYLRAEPGLVYLVSLKSLLVLQSRLIQTNLAMPLLQRFRNTSQVLLPNMVRWTTSSSSIRL
jgi:hypothetical protein